MIKFFTLLLISLSFMISCSQREDEASSVYLLPWPDDKGDIYLQNVVINSLEDSQTARGAAAKIFVHPKLTSSSFEGERPNIRLAKANGVMVPQDTVSQELLTAYAHMERLYNLDRDLGWDDILAWPRIIGIEVLAVDDNGHHLLENAAYDRNLDVLLFFPSLGVDQLALSLNPGVIAHEHFHAFFNAVLRKALPSPVKTNAGKTKKKLSLSSRADLVKKKNQFTLRAYSEAFSDLWGIIYSKNLNYISQSIESLGVNRNYSVAISPKKFNSIHSEIVAHTSSNRVVINAYKMASHISRLFLKKMNEDLKQKKQGRQSSLATIQYQQAEYVKAALYKLRDVLLSQVGSTYDASSIVEVLFDLENITENDCAMLMPYLEKGNVYAKKCEDFLAKNDSELKKAETQR